MLGPGMRKKKAKEEMIPALEAGKADCRRPLKIRSLGPKATTLTR